MEPTLAEFIAANERKAWRPGSVDCCMVLASWAMWLGHTDPAEHLRGTYTDDAGFGEIIASAGGAIPVVQKCILKIGGRSIATPRCGSVGVIGSRSNHTRQWGAIYDGDRWLVRGKDRFMKFSAPILAAWEI